jgi:hypothetical protein
MVYKQKCLFSKTETRKAIHVVYGISAPVTMEWYKESMNVWIYSILMFEKGKNETC